MTAFPLDKASPEEALDALAASPDARSAFFAAPEKVDHLVRSMRDLQELYERSCRLFNEDRQAALKLMLHVFFQTPYGFGMHHVFDAIGLYMQNAIDDEVCQYIGAQWRRLADTLDDEDKAWWRKECAAWGCELTD